MKGFCFIFLVVFIFSCSAEEELNENILAEYLELNQTLELADLVACAGGSQTGLLGGENKPTDIFFYPIQGATDFRYFEAENIADSTNFNKYIAQDLQSEPIFNGYLWKFNGEPFSGEKMGIVTYKTAGKMHVCEPIRLKTYVKPTEINSELVEVFENGVTPSFTWNEGLIDENKIYFQIISDLDNNLISGTYTFEKEFTFYDLDNVVFNITDTTSVPSLQTGQQYKFSLMGVSEDNWVNLFAEKEFSTN